MNTFGCLLDCQMRTFQRLMNEVFRDYLYKFILIFLDDVLDYCTNKADHWENLRTIFQTLRALNLKLKPKKCKLFQREVVYLSHIIGNGGAKPDPDKVSAVKHWPVPKKRFGLLLASAINIDAL